MTYDEYHRRYNRENMHSLTTRIHTETALEWWKLCQRKGITTHAALGAFVAYALGDPIIGKEKYAVAKIRLAKLLNP